MRVVGMIVDVREQVRKDGSKRLIARLLDEETAGGDLIEVTIRGTVPDGVTARSVAVFQRVRWSSRIWQGRPFTGFDCDAAEISVVGGLGEKPPKKAA